VIGGDGAGGERAVGRSAQELDPHQIRDGTGVGIAGGEVTVAAGRGARTLALRAQTPIGRSPTADGFISKQGTAVIAADRD